MLTRTKHELPGAVPEVSRSWLSKCGPAAEAGRHGRRVGTRSSAGRSFRAVLVTARVIATTSCPWSWTFCRSCASAGQSRCRTSRWSSGQGRLPLFRSIGAASASRFLTSLMSCRGFFAAHRGSMFHSLTLASRVRRTAGRGRLRRELMVLLPSSQHRGGGRARSAPPQVGRDRVAGW
jgi:hypothetical protein